MENLLMKNEILVLSISAFLLIYSFAINSKLIREWWSKKRKEIVYNNTEFFFTTLLLALSIYMSSAYLELANLIKTGLILIFFFSSLNIYQKLYFTRGDEYNYATKNIVSLLFKIFWQYFLLVIVVSFLILAIAIYCLYFLSCKLIRLIKRIGQPQKWIDYLALYLLSFLLLNLLNLKSYVLNIGLPILIMLLIIVLSKMISQNIDIHLKKVWQNILSSFNVAIDKILN